jgi:hypothetical protein
MEEDNKNMMEINFEELAEQISKISEAFDIFKKSKLTRKALIVLIQNIKPGKLNRIDIERVLDSLPLLKEHYLKNNESVDVKEFREEKKDK